MTAGVASRVVRTVTDRQDASRADAVAVEEPLELRLRLPGGPPVSFTVTMRTPGHDFELAAGFLHTEGVVCARADIARITYCVDGPQEQRYNVVNIELRDGAAFDRGRLLRHHAMTSSCGVCGKASLEAVHAAGIAPPDPAMRLRADWIWGLPAMLRREQAAFDQTGGLHAAGLFAGGGDLVVLREDVGRHNAVDKVVGERLFSGAGPLSGHVLVVSGRASFEIVQKAAAAGIPAVCAVSAPSTLAVDLARSLGMILVGFVRERRFNVYSGERRVDGAIATLAAEAGAGPGPAP